MRLLSSLLMILLLPLIQLLRAQSNDSRSLDAILQDYAYRAFVNPRTGTPYDGNVPSNLTGISIAALRLRSGSLFYRGVPKYKEFEIPIGVYEQPYVERLVLVYQNLGNWSSTYYSLEGYTYLTPVLGLLAYDAFDLSAKNLKELDITASDKPMLIRFSRVNSVPDGATVKCVQFDLDGPPPQFSNLTSRNVCSTTQQGHFAIVVEGIVPSSEPVLPPPPGKVPANRPKIGGGDHDNNNTKVWIIVGAVAGGFALLVLLSLLVCCLRRYKHINKMQQMEKAAEVGEALHMTSVGDTRAPVAMGTRTQPVLENEYVP